MKASSEMIVCICVLLAIIPALAGCTGTGNPADEPNYTRPILIFNDSQESTGTGNPVQDPNCTRPALIFNDSQETTRICGIYYTSPFESFDGMVGRVPLGGVVYRSQGFTRIFDATGKQILLVNDSESKCPTPAGYQTAACVGGYIPNMRTVTEGDKIENIYVTSYDTCIASIINIDGSCLKSNILNF